MAKIGIIGVGKNGEAFAHKLLPLGHDLYLLNRTPQRAYGVMEDLVDGYPHCRDRIHVCESYDNDFLSTDMAFILVKGDYEYSDFKALTDLRTKGLPRDGFLLNNVANNLKGYSGYVIVVSNPVDLNAKQIMLRAALSPSKIVAYGSNLDTWRGQNKAAELLDISLDPTTDNRQNLNLLFIGEHGDKAFGLWSSATYEGKSLTQMGIDEESTQKIDDYVRKRGVEVILKKYDTTIGTVQPLPALVHWLTPNSPEHVISASIFDEDHDIFYGQPASNANHRLVPKMPFDMSKTENEHLEAAIAKIKGAESFAESLYVDKRIRNILYIDDQFDTLTPVAKVIKAMARHDPSFKRLNKAVVHTARTLKEANEILYSTMGGIDVLITDQRLIGDEKDGIRFVKEDVVPNHPFTVPVVLSGQANEDDLKSAIGPAFGGFIQKPLDIENPNHWHTIREALEGTDETIVE